MRWSRHAASLSCAAAVGALLFSVHVATTVFREMPGDRVLAGRIAGRSFTGAYGIATVAALVAVAVTLATRSGAIDRALAAAMAAFAIVELAWIAPAIVSHGAGWPGSFASLHAFGGGLHVAIAAIALLLAWRLLDERAA